MLFAGWTQSQFFSIIWPQAGQGASAVWGCDQQCWHIHIQHLQGTISPPCHYFFTSSSRLESREELLHTQQQMQRSQTTATEVLRLLPLPTLSQYHLFPFSEFKSKTFFTRVLPKKMPPLRGNLMLRAPPSHVSFHPTNEGTKCTEKH